MPTVTVLIIVALIGFALLLLIVGLIVYFAKRGKGKAVAAQPQVPGPNAAALPPLANELPGYPAPEASPGGAWGQQQAWGGAPDALAQQSVDTTPPTVEWQDPGAPVAPPPADSNQIPGSAYRTQESVQSTGDSEAYVTTPSAPPEPPPNPELFLTRPGAPRKTSMMDMNATLHADDGSVINLDRLMMRVGRHPECDIVVPTPGASRQHAEFEFRDGQWIVTDLNSGNGTWVNGVRVQQHNLASGDEVRIDQTRFRFMSGA